MINIAFGKQLQINGFTLVQLTVKTEPLQTSVDLLNAAVRVNCWIPARPVQLQQQLTQHSIKKSNCSEQSQWEKHGGMTEQLKPN